MKKLVGGLAVILTSTLTLAACGGTTTSDPGSETAQAVTPKVSSADSTAPPPWPAPTDVPQRVARAQLDLGPMGAAEHYHPRLRVVVSGRDVPVPANIGVDPSTGAMSALHTHESDGTLHIEAARAGEVFTLGQLFTEWGVRLTKTQIGGIRAAGTGGLIVTSNGKPVAGNPRALRLQPDQQIVIRVP